MYLNMYEYNNNYMSRVCSVSNETWELIKAEGWSLRHRSVDNVLQSVFKELYEQRKYIAAMQEIDRISRSNQERLTSDIINLLENGNAANR